MEKCPVCGSTKLSVYRKDVKSVYSDHPYDIGHCEECDHYFTSPAPTASELDTIYTQKYSYDAHHLIQAEKKQRAKIYADFIAGLGDKKRKVLEVGCMHGYLLKELKQQGFVVEGVELDQSAVDFCQKHGLNVRQSSVEDYLQASPNPHDVIVMSHVLEHIAKPEEQLSGLNKTLNPGGQLVIIVPNSQSGTRGLFGRYWGYWQVPVHINHFNRQSIERVMQQSGYKIKTVKYFGGDSLFFLSSLANLLGSKNDSKSLSPAKQLLVKVASIVLRPWVWIGSEDMMVVAEKVG